MKSSCSRLVWAILLGSSPILLAADQCPDIDPPNLPAIKATLKEYYHTGPYDAAVNEVVDRGIDYLRSRGKAKKGDAVVFDLDETLLSNEKYIDGVLLAGLKTFALPETSLRPWQLKAEDPSLPTKRLYDAAASLGYTIFLITGRPEIPQYRQATERNLSKVGCDGYERLIMKPADYKQPSVIPFKSGARRQIEEKGHTIVLNIGDQESDLKGGYAERTFKLPNPFYFVP
ncbi:HAD superfamily, subfamily IIIB (Acid phosphatase) [Planctomycetes bacterium Pan216]|uniref:HAD superfamily, subfamily IIIB (Acid phosphatase) n=1 Tax=Kolteria novifilia TaxID=2527975 RepID=A0A518BBL8_9BACT|nr:HAD superfamily, subfamily IIIB (Acid phosphatase) [Planctomycetes bacterium Pan216]